MRRLHGAWLAGAMLTVAAAFQVRRESLAPSHPPRWPAAASALPSSRPAVPPHSKDLCVYAHAEQRGPGLWDEVCSPKMQWWSLLALADLFVINRPHTRPLRGSPHLVRRQGRRGGA